MNFKNATLFKPWQVENLIPLGIHFIAATWISIFYYLPCTTFTFIYYLYSFRHSYLELSLSFTTWICFATWILFTTCIHFTTWNFHFHSLRFATCLLHFCCILAPPKRNQLERTTSPEPSQLPILKNV